MSAEIGFGVLAEASTRFTGQPQRWAPAPELTTAAARRTLESEGASRR